MQIDRFSAAAAGRAERTCRAARNILALGAVALLAGCGGLSGPGAPATAVAPVPAKAALPLDQAVLSLADATLSRAQLPPPGPSGRHILVIDPLIDRATGGETATTRSMEQRIAGLVRDRHAALELHPFTTAALNERPLILLGAITGVAEAGSLTVAAKGAPPAAYRIWAVLADLNTGRVLSHETAWVQPQDVDATPTAFYRDSPVWLADGVTAAYLRTCAANPGDPVDPAYLAALRSQALVADGVRAYEAGRHAAALDLYDEARQLGAGSQVRIGNGLYLANWALGRRDAAEAAFGEVIDQGLARGRLAVKFVFSPGSAAFWPDPAVIGPYPLWIRQIATRTAVSPVCLDIEGHTSPTGPAALNERLSLARAERLRTRLVAVRPALAGRTRATGLGSEEPIVGTGADDATDALDRRVEFEPLACPAIAAAGDGGRQAGLAE